MPSGSTNWSGYFVLFLFIWTQSWLDGEGRMDSGKVGVKYIMKAQLYLVLEI